MSTYTPAQLSALWAGNGGFTGPAPYPDGSYSASDVAGAIAKAESGGNPAANVSDPAPSDPNARSYGLWQINSPNLPTLATQGVDVSDILDPSVNAQAAIALYNGRGGQFVDWTTYTSGAYRQYLPGTSSVSANPTTAASTTTTVLQSTNQAIALLNTWILSNNVNVLYKAIFLGFVLCVLATIPATEKFAGWAALAILLILIIQQEPTNA